MTASLKSWLTVKSRRKCQMLSILFVRHVVDDIPERRQIYDVSKNFFEYSFILIENSGF